MREFICQFTHIAQDQHASPERWNIDGQLVFAGDTYEFTFTFEAGEYGGSSIDVTLDGVPVPADSYFEREFGVDAVRELCVQEFYSLMEARRKATEVVVSARTKARFAGEIDEAAGVVRMRSM